MSGTRGHIQRKKQKRQVAVEKETALNNNRMALLTAVADYMHDKYSETSFYNEHPLVTAIQKSANGLIVDLTQLQNDINNYQLPLPEA